MSSKDEITKDILIKAIESGYVTKYSSAHTKDALEKNLDNITRAYKEIFKVVNSPED